MREVLELVKTDAVALAPYGRVFLVALITGLALTPLVRYLALRTGTVDHPNERRINQVDMPTAGGLAIVLAFWTGLLVSGVFDTTLRLLSVGATIIVITGILDDILELRPGVKLAGQLLAALALVLAGVKIEFVTNPFGGMWYIGWLGIPLTILWVVAITNMINFIDGLDGLAAGVSVIAAAPLFLVAVQRGHVLAAMMTVALAGGALGFLKYNFNPAKIIMGDTGAMFLGFMLAAASVQGAMKGAATVAMVIPALALGLPICDTVFAIVRRRRNGKPIYAADKGHLHHRLLEMGLSQRKAVLAMYGVASALGATAILVAAAQRTPITVGVVIAVGFGAVSFGRKLDMLPPRPSGSHRGPSGGFTA